MGSDPSLLQHGEDSLQLFWRPDGRSEWSVYPFYKKINTSPNDNYGRINLSYTMNGDYVFGNIDPAAVSNHETDAADEVIAYPNPASTQVSVQLPSSNIHSNYQVKLFNESGAEVHCTSNSNKENLLTVGLPVNIPAGKYVIQVYSDKTLIANSKFVKVN